MVSGPTAACAASTLAVGAVLARSAKRVARRLGRRVARHHDLDIGRHRGLDRLGEHVAVAGKHQARRQQFDDRTQLAEIARHQRIGRRDRRVGNAGIERAERDERVLDVVAGENDERPLGGEIARQQRLADAAGKFQRLLVGDGAPVAVIVALGEEDLARRFRGPELQPFGELVRDRCRAAAASATGSSRRRGTQPSTSCGPSVTGRMPGVGAIVASMLIRSPSGLSARHRASRRARRGFSAPRAMARHSPNSRAGD